ncbi:MAG: sulfatase-like hydrolase/transferase, partial [Massilibacteroides sp.]|nr:sulfatase-like hydrolase/transferase [Massilibacteroides sp.]
HWLSGEKVDHCKYMFRSDKVGDVFNGNMGMAGKKRSNMDGGIHVPLTYYWPGHFKPRACKELISNYDFIATMADMLGEKINKKKNAISYYKLLTDEKATMPKDRFVLCDSREGPTVIENRGWKLRYDGVNGQYELYNVRTDFAEFKNVADQHPDIVARLKKLLLKNVTHTEDRGVPFNHLSQTYDE